MSSFSRKLGADDAISLLVESRELHPQVSPPCQGDHRGAHVSVDRIPGVRHGAVREYVHVHDGKVASLALKGHGRLSAFWSIFVINRPWFNARLMVCAITRSSSSKSALTIR
jgi:hypothetical protein